MLDQERSKDFVMRGLISQPPEAGVWEQSPEPPKARRSGGVSPNAWRFLPFFNKNNAFLDILRLKFLL